MEYYFASGTVMTVLKLEIRLSKKQDKNPYPHRSDIRMIKSAIHRTAGLEQQGMEVGQS